MSKKITPKYDDSISFLERWLPGGPWVLVAIDPNKKGLEADTFGGTDVKGGRLREWLEQQGARRNIYFTVNPCSRHLTTKPSREHIRGLSWLHVDLDPRAGEDFNAERARILALITDPSALGLPKPTCIIDSGGGYQGFWRLKLPEILDGSASDYEEAKRYNKQLELVLGGDNCHNVDRIMRLPGTVNRPDARKRAKGRTEALASVVEFNSELHDLAKFTKAPEVQGSAAPGFSGRTVEVSGNVARFSSVDDIEELRDKRYNQCRVVIVQGLDPDDPDKFKGSRSEWLFFVCCEMVRAGCSDDAIYSVITDPDFGISNSVLDKGSGIEEYAVRQIERAREEAVDPILRELNDRHAVIGSIGTKGLCRILGEEWDPALDRARVVYQSQSDFMLRYRKRKREWIDNDGKAQSMPAAVWWLEHPLGRYYDTAIFAPGKSVPPNVYNLWKGFAVAADPSKSCELYLRHLEQNICAGNPEHVEYLLNWMAYAVQKPWEPGQVAVVLRGDQGTGKGVFAEGFGALWGRHFSHIADSAHLVGQFSAHTRECVVMYADEAVASDDSRAESKLKALVTEATLVTEAKGVDAEQTPNYIHLIMASNAKWVVPAGAFDRRYFVLDVASSHRQDSTYFRALKEQFYEQGGREALLALLLARDLTGFNVRNKPDTEGLEEQKEHSLTPEEEWWYGKLRDREVLPGHGWPDYVYVETLLHDYELHMGKNRGNRTSSYRLGRFLELVTAKQVERKQLKPATPVMVVQRDGIGREVARPYAYLLPDSDSCRALWAALGKPANWPKDAEEMEATYGEVGPDDLADDSAVLG